MKKQANDNSYLFEDEVKVVSESVSRAPDLDLTFNQVFSLRQMSNPDAEVSKYTVADSDSGTAELLKGLSEYPKINISGSELTTDIYKAGISFDIPVEDINNSRRWGRKLDVEFVDRAKRKVDEKLNAFAYAGDTKFGVPGILELSGVTTFTGSSFDTANLNLADQVTNAINAIPIEFRRRPYSLVMADAQWKRLTRIGNTTTNQSWIKMIKEEHPNVQFIVEAQLDSGTNLASGGTLTAGTAMLIPSDSKLVRIPVGRMPSAVFKASANVAFDEKISGKVKAKIGAIEAPHPTSVVKISGWS